MARHQGTNDVAGAAIDAAAAAARAELDGRLPRSRFARMRDVGSERVLELPFEDRDGGSARLEIILGRRGEGALIEARLFNHKGQHAAVRASEAELRAIALTATAALGWIAKAPE